MTAALRDAGLAGEVVCLHTRLSSFGWLSGGPSTVVDAFIDSGTTLVVPTFTTWAEAPRPHGRHLAHNGEDDDLPRRLPERGFDPRSRLVDRDMGLVPRDVLHRQDAVRGDHPMSSFTALGPRALDVAGPQRPLAPLAPLEALVAARGWVLTAGCGMSSVSLLHLVAPRLGVRPFRRWALGADGVVHEVAVPGCARAFGRLDALVAPLAREVSVGTSTWRWWPARELLDLAVQARREDPELLVCSPSCVRCADAAAGGPLG